MKAAILQEPERLVVQQIPDPVPAAGEIVMRVRACGVCGSDIRYFHGDNPWSQHTLGYRKPNPPNMILGHEVAGEAQLGDRTIRCSALAFKVCEKCRLCRTGRHNLCPNTGHLGHGAGWESYQYNPGGMAELMPVWEDKVYELPDHVSFEEATFLDGLGVAVHAVHRSGLRPGDAALVMGGGPIGLSIQQVCRALGARCTIVADVYEKPLEVGERLGADRVVDARAENVAEAVREATNGWGAEAVFETTGLRTAQQSALDALAKGGTAVFLAGAAGGLDLGESFFSGERSITTSSNNYYRDYQTGLDLLATGRIEVAPMITHRFGLDDIARAFETVSHKAEEQALKVVILP